MPQTLGPSDTPEALGALIRDLQTRLSRVETQARAQNTSIEAPGRLRYKDASGVTRFELGGFSNGGTGLVQYGPDGRMLQAAEQAQLNSPQTVSSTTYADAGPTQTVTVTAGPSGALLVVLSAVVSATATTVASSVYYSFASSGGRVTAAQDVNSLQVSRLANTDAPAFRGTRAALLLGCDPKTPVTVTGQLRVSAATWTVDDRSLVAVPL